MTIIFPSNPAGQTPPNTFSSTSTPLANTSNNFTYVWNGSAWLSTGGGGGGGGTVSSVDVSGGSTGLTYSGGPVTTAGIITMAGVLGIANGGTGTTTSGGALNALLPPQTGQGGKFLQTNGATVSWTAEAGSGTVTSVNVSGGSTGLTFSGGPITAAGNLTMAGTLAVANGGTGATTTIAAINALLPSQSGQGGNQLGTDGTNVSWVSSGIELPSGTVLAFFQAAAPTGWTQVTTAALNNSAIRIVTTAGGGTGGTIGFNTLFSPTSTYTGTLNVTSGQVGDTSLSEAQLASHTHSYIESDNGSRRITGTAPACNNGVFPAITGATGGGSTHTHSLIGAVAGGNFTTDFDLQYIDMILASKN